MGRTACRELQCLYEGTVFLQIRRWEVMTKKQLLLTILRRHLNAISQQQINLLTAETLYLRVYYNNNNNNILQ